MQIVVTIGLGYIGLPTSALIASNGIRVIGVDVNPKIVSCVNRGEIHIVEPDLDLVVQKVIKKELLTAHDKILPGDVYLIVVPTPFKGNHQPDISHIESATENLIPLLKKDDLYIIESTSPIGTTEKMRDLIYNKRPELKNKINIAYCPERVLPGNIMHELVNNDRVIGGVDERSTIAAVKFYSQFVQGKLHGTTARLAEMCKLTENASRDVQIAFANELSLICDKANIDVWELIKLANKHPRVNILQPGCGVGGHCIAVDPYFITSTFPLESKIIRTAREINNYKAFWCVEKIQKESLQFEIKQGIKPKVALLGLAFKPDIDDLRESPAVYIAEQIQEIIPSNNLFIVEPNIKSDKRFPLTDLDKAIEESDIIVLLVSHKEFKDIFPSIKSKKIIQFSTL